MIDGIREADRKAGRSYASGGHTTYSKGTPTNRGSVLHRLHGETYSKMKSELSSLQDQIFQMEWRLNGSSQPHNETP